MQDTYATSMIRELLERGTQPDEDFFRMKVTGNGATHWLNVSREQLEAIASILNV